MNEEFFKHILGEASWYLIGLAVVWLARGFIEEFLSGLMMIRGNDVNLDDNLLLGTD